MENAKKLILIGITAALAFYSYNHLNKQQKTQNLVTEQPRLSEREHDSETRKKLKKVILAVKKSLPRPTIKKTRNTIDKPTAFSQLPIEMRTIIEESYENGEILDEERELIAQHFLNLAKDLDQQENEEYSSEEEPEDIPFDELDIVYADGKTQNESENDKDEDVAKENDE